MVDLLILSFWAIVTRDRHAAPPLRNRSQKQSSTRLGMLEIFDRGRVDE
ncbi:hypothetical protein QT971_06170 [Microcoleus sp. herbarium19]